MESTERLIDSSLDSMPCFHFPGCPAAGHVSSSEETMILPGEGLTREMETETQKELSCPADEVGRSEGSKFEISSLHRFAQSCHLLEAEFNGRSRAFFQEIRRTNFMYAQERHRLFKELACAGTIQIQQLQDRNSELILTGDLLMSKVHDLEEREVMMKSKVEVLRQDMEGLYLMITSEILLYENELKKLEETVATMRGLSANFEQEMEKVRDALMAQVADLQQRDAGVKNELHECQRQLKSSKDDVDAKDLKIKELEETAGTLAAANTKLEQKLDKTQKRLCKERAGCGGSYLDGLMNPFLFENTVKDVFASITTFSKLFSAYRRPEQSNPARHIVKTSNFKDVYIVRDHHWTTMLKAWISQNLFHNFESEKFEIRSNSAMFLNPEERVRDCFAYFQTSNNVVAVKTESPSVSSTLDPKSFERLFVEYCVSRRNMILWPETYQLFSCFTAKGDEVSGFENFRAQHGDAWNLVKHYIITARKVWNLHKLCLSYEPPATIFRVSVGDVFNSTYMDSCVTLDDDDKFAPKVGAMIFPGFRLRNSVIKCQVYFGVV